MTGLEPNISGSGGLPLRSMQNGNGQDASLSFLSWHFMKFMLPSAATVRGPGAKAGEHPSSD